VTYIRNVRFLSSEFPNDNSDLHVGTIWMSEAPCGPPEAHFADEDGEEAASTPAPAAPMREGVASSVRTVDDALACTDEPDASDESDDGSDIEVVETLGPFDAIDEGPRAPSDPYATLVATLAAVARDVGAPQLAARLADTLDIDPVAMAWRAILRGESDDYAACGAATLDEWAADTLARLMSSPSRASQLRRELRSRGVVAFGLVEAA
jgi:hypothetical protein